ncbi:hypothetical protein AZ54_23980 [Xanthomonas oryzae pv. oryzae PXO86]|uniref:Uncharacterized protein n=2 Tax=Xanthomonas oryzae TaxID=347 RepID=A0A0K0GRF8_XANOP|nr:hypothetical protein PXO_03251 [Xanthomonas oryzae pv. oryzae PXO99A]AJQ85699.1 hypothetical protein AZ54_23980 [Xanthomonas oryzae pv. oryzae PXO86]
MPVTGASDDAAAPRRAEDKAPDALSQQQQQRHVRWRSGCWAIAAADVQPRSDTATFR